MDVVTVFYKVICMEEVSMNISQGFGNPREILCADSSNPYMDWRNSPDSGTLNSQK